jgi:hypothetical protein
MFCQREIDVATDMVWRSTAGCGAWSSFPGHASWRACLPGPLKASSPPRASSATSATSFDSILWHVSSAALHVPLTRAALILFRLDRPAASRNQDAGADGEKSAQARPRTLRDSRVFGGSVGADCTVAVTRRTSRAQETASFAPIARTSH